MQKEHSDYEWNSGGQTQTVHFSCLVSRGCCAPSVAPSLFAKHPGASQKQHTEGVTSCLLSALPEVGENETSENVTCISSEDEMGI